MDQVATEGAATVDEPHEEYQAAMRDALRVIHLNISGLVVRINNLDNNGSFTHAWVYGQHQWPALPSVPGPTPETITDPMAGLTVCGLVEWHHYLKSYYWPRLRAIEAARNPPDPDKLFSPATPITRPDP